MTHMPEASVVDLLSRSLIDGDGLALADFFKRNGVTPPLTLWDPAAGDMASTSFDFLIGFWHRHLNGSPWPSEAAIDPVQLQPALGSLLVCEPLPDLSDFRIRLYGSRLALDMGRDLTGAHISEVDPGSYITTFFLACYRAVATRGVPLFTRHVPSASSYATEIRRLLLPFGPPAAINRILVGVDSDARRPLGRPTWARRK